MTLQGLRVRDALGIGEGSTIPSRLLGSCKGRGLWLQVTPAEGLWLGSSRCGGGSRCGQLWEGSWTEESRPLQREAWHQPSQAAAPAGSAAASILSTAGGTLPRWGFNVFLCGEGWWRQMVYSTAPLWEEKDGAPALEAEVLSLGWGTEHQVPPNPPPRPGLALEVHQRVSPVFCPPS